MAKINRYNGNLKAFGSESTGTERTIFGDTAQSNTLDGNITADLFRGWGIIGPEFNPTKQDFNGLGFTLGQLLAYLHQAGIPEWNTLQEFYQGSVVTTLSGIYRLKSGGNGSVNPDTDGGVNWELQPTRAQVDAKASISGQLFTGEINYRGAGSINTNTSYGVNALSSNTTGSSNTALGRDSLSENTTGSENTASGVNSLLSNTTGTQNTAVGRDALSSNTTGSSNTAVGRNSLLINTTGSNNTANGVNSLSSNTTGPGNTALGKDALLSNTTGSSNTSVGRNSLSSNTTGPSNTASGVNALSSNTTGSNNTANGVNSLLSSTIGSNNTAVGRDALSGNTEGNENTANGVNSLVNNTTGSSNSAVGRDALSSNTTGSGNTALSPLNRFGNYNPVFNPTTENDRFCMGSTGITNAYIQVAWTVVSDARDKTNFADVPHGLGFVNALQPTRYQFRIDRNSEKTNGPVRYGFKAQDVLDLEGSNPVIVDNEDPDKLRIVDTAIIPVLVNALQELDAKFEAYVLAHP